MFLGDDLSGIHAALGALAALRHRDRTGEGQHVDVALVDALLFQSNSNIAAGALGLPTPRTGNEFTVCAPTNMYDCLDGNVFAGVLTRPALAKTRRDDRPPRTRRRSPLRNAQRAPEPSRRSRTAARRLVRAHAASRTSWTRSKPADCLRCASTPTPKPPPNRTCTTATCCSPRRLHDGTDAPLVGPAAKFSRTPTRVRTSSEPLGASTETAAEGAGLRRGDACPTTEARGDLRWDALKAVGDG